MLLHIAKKYGFDFEFTYFLKTNYLKIEMPFIGEFNQFSKNCKDGTI